MRCCVEVLETGLGESVPGRLAGGPSGSARAAIPDCARGVRRVDSLLSRLSGRRRGHPLCDRACGCCEVASSVAVRLWCVVWTSGTSWLVAALSAAVWGVAGGGAAVVLGFSWATCAMAYVILRDRLRAAPVEALALALMLGLSPFFFGESFSVLTDNPTWFFVVLALERLLAYAHEPKTQRLVAFALCGAAATTMRQVAVWLFIPACVAVLSAPLSRRRRLSMAPCWCSALSARGASDLLGRAASSGDGASRVHRFLPPPECA